MIYHQDFIDNKYFNLYLKIINNRISNPVDRLIYNENHHILPKSMGGNRAKSNMVRLYPREHFVAHKLLAKCTSGQSYYKMLEAVSYFTNNKKRKLKFTSRDYETLKIANSIAASIRNKGNIGWKSRKIDSEETRKLKSINTSNTRWVSNGISELYTQEYQKYIDIGWRMCRLKRYAELLRLDDSNEINKLLAHIKILLKFLDIKIGAVNRRKYITINSRARHSIEYLNYVINNLNYHIHNTNIDITIPAENIFKLKPPKKKREFSIEHRTNISNTRKLMVGELNPRTGMKNSPESNENISNALLIRNAKLRDLGLPTTHNKGKRMNYPDEQLRAISATLSQQIVCDHCGDINRLGNHARWHGDNCKHRL
jgi:hypothetical protein